MLHAFKLYTGRDNASHVTEGTVRAASGHAAAAPPSVARNFRRPM
jgi:hypothetical protein